MTSQAAATLEVGDRVKQHDRLGTVSRRDENTVDIAWDLRGNADVPERFGVAHCGTLERFPKSGDRVIVRKANGMVDIFKVTNGAGDRQRVRADVTPQHQARSRVERTRLSGSATKRRPTRLRPIDRPSASERIVIAAARRAGATRFGDPRVRMAFLAAISTVADRDCKLNHENELRVFLFPVASAFDCAVLRSRVGRSSESATSTVVGWDMLKDPSAAFGCDGDGREASERLIK
jgi:hypothetical protein